MKKAAIHLAMHLSTSMEFFYQIPLCDLVDIIEEVASCVGE